MSEAEPPLDEQAFRRALGDLIQAARTNGIDVCGGWRVDGTDEATDIGIEVYELAPAED